MRSRRLTFAPNQSSELHGRQVITEQLDGLVAERNRGTSSNPSSSGSQRPLGAFRGNRAREALGPGHQAVSGAGWNGDRTQRPK